MSRENIEKYRSELAAKRQEKFRAGLTELLEEIESAKECDEYFINEILIPASA